MRWLRLSRVLVRLFVKRPDQVDRILELPLGGVIGACVKKQRELLFFEFREIVVQPVKPVIRVQKIYQ